ncbi:putative enterotoxin [Ophiocordyceps unilateralis]|uniref:Enterotoxin n=1 Tax=Ophiocordyceps unilateralis TaxID=268505 RepID=A0A2A9PP90_OPHUN|nr:putative enterotoxin [Ophiocordyceps unilateralis]
MGNRARPWLLLAWTAVQLFPGCTNGAVPVISPVPSQDNIAEVVWRAEYSRTPEEAEQAGGLLSQCLDNINRGATFNSSELEQGTSLYAHTNGLSTAASQYVSVTPYPTMAFWFANAQQFKADGFNRPIYLYKIRAGPAMIPVNASLGQYSPVRMGGELCVAGRIPWHQVLGWHVISLTTVGLIFDTDNRVREDAVFYQNPKYKAASYPGQRTVGEPQPQLAGFPADSEAWNQRPWSKHRGKSTRDFLGRHIWHTVCSRDYPCYKRFRPHLRSASLAPNLGKDDDASTLPSTRPAVRSKAPRAVFISHYLWPEEVSQQGGLLTAADRVYQNQEAPGKAYTLKEHLDVSNPNRSTSFLPAFENFGAAAEHAAAVSKRHTPGFEGVVYLVKATPNMVDVGLTVGNYYGNLDPTKQRFAVVGGVLWSQVMGWLTVPANYTRPSTKRVKNKTELHSQFRKIFQDKQIYFVRNEGYDQNRFHNLAANNQAQPQLFSSSDPKAAIVQFMQHHGAAVGWEGSFPLFWNKVMGNGVRAIITANMSAQAKLNGAVSHPQDSDQRSTWSYIWNDVVPWIALTAGLAAMVAEVASAANPVVDAALLADIGIEAVEEAGVLFEAEAELGDGGAAVAVESGTLTVDAEEAAAEAAEFETVEAESLEDVLPKPEPEMEPIVKEAPVGAR